MLVVSILSNIMMVNFLLLQEHFILFSYPLMVLILQAHHHFTSQPKNSSTQARLKVYH